MSKALNDAPDISETLRKTILETAVEMGYKRIHRKSEEARKLCILIENMDYTEATHFGYDMITGFPAISAPSALMICLSALTRRPL